MIGCGRPVSNGCHGMTSHLGPAAVDARRARHLVLVLGDQLDAASAAFDGFDPRADVVWMAEVTREATHVWSHQARIAMFLAAMRHFRDACQARGWPVDYRTIDTAAADSGFTTALRATVHRLQPKRLIVVEPGEWRVRAELVAAARELRVPLDIRPDRHFLCSQEEFAAFARGRKQLRMEFFYRHMRQRTGLLMDRGQPIGGRWNFDSENRKSFGKAGPNGVRQPRSFTPDAVTRGVLRDVAARFSSHPGRLDHFDWPVTQDQARQALDDFIAHRLHRFGDYQDAMWTDEPFLFHSRLSAAMNLKLLDPREVIQAAVDAGRDGAPLAAVEGFVRQILGWREYVRGVYWHLMPGYADRNELGATQSLPPFYWTGKTEMNCLRQALGQTLAYGYAHHIQRLMVTGLFALLLGVRPLAVHAWYLAVYVDAVEWVELPNTLGMSQYADGGVMASKPYVATGKYIQRMSNYCQGCRFDPNLKVGPKACPFTTLYWDFLQRHRERLSANPRMSLQVKNVDRLSAAERRDIGKQATQVRAACCE